MHEAQQKLTSYSDWIVLKPAGTLSTCTSHENLLSVESTAMPSFLQRRHIRFSIQYSRAICLCRMRRRLLVFVDPNPIVRVDIAAAERAFPEVFGFA